MASIRPSFGCLPQCRRLPASRTANDASGASFEDAGSASSRHADQAAADRSPFSPKGGCTNAIVRQINAAKTSILVQAYSFTSTPIAKALVEAHMVLRR